MLLRYYWTSLRERTKRKYPFPSRTEVYLFHEIAIGLSNFISRLLRIDISASLVSEGTKIDVRANISPSSICIFLLFLFSPIAFLIRSRAPRLVVGISVVLRNPQKANKLFQTPNFFRTFVIRRTRFSLGLKPR